MTQVTIVLNEREPLKRQAAENLSRELSLLGITSTRPKIGDRIIQDVIGLKGSIVILDYILGDATTGLDLCDALMKPVTESRLHPTVLFFTDEPSVETATQAIRSGAKDYLLIDNPTSFARVVQAIKQEIARRNIASQRSDSDCYDTDELIFNSNSALSTLNLMSSAFLKQERIIVLHGARGSGKRSFLKQALNKTGATSTSTYSKSEIGTQLTLSWRNLETSLLQTLQLKSSALNRIVYLKDLEYDRDLLISQCHQVRNYLEERALTLVLATSDGVLLSTLTSELGACPIVIPNLVPDRKEEIPNLIQRFHLQLSRQMSKKIKLPSTEEISWLNDQSWPGNISQLRDVLFDSLCWRESQNTPLMEILEARYLASCVLLDETEIPRTSVSECNKIEDFAIISSLIKNSLSERAASLELGISIQRIREVRLHHFDGVNTILKLGSLSAFADMQGEK